MISSNEDVRADDGVITVQITDAVLVDSGNFIDKWVHSWVQVIRNPVTGSYVRSGGKQGNYTPPSPEVLSAPLLEKNNQQIPVGTIIDAYEIVLRGVPAYEAYLGGDAGTSDWDPILITGAAQGTGLDFQPVHVLDKITREFVRTGLLWLFPNQDAVDVGTYLGGFYSYSLDDTEQTPVYTKNWNNGGSVVPPGALCQAHGYLADRQANIDMATATPPRVQTYEVFAGVGRCSCIQEQGRDSTKIPYPYTAFWDATAGTRGRWVGSVFIQTCCGCARLEFDIPEENDDLVDDWPPAQGYLYLNKACDSTSVTDPYILKYQCSGDGYTLFAGAGPKNCSGVAPFPCNNSFLVLVKCADCTLGQGPDCQYCTEICGPPIFTVTVSGMTGGYTDYNGKWNLVPDGDCTWQVTCGDIIVTLTITVVGGTTFVTVTFAGAAGGGLTYKDIGTSGANILCASDRTLNTVSPPNPAVGIPATIAISTITCTSCQDFCSWLVANYPTLHVTFGMDGTGSVACVNGTSWALTWDAVNSWWTTGSVSAPAGCTPNTMGDFKITCSGGRLTLISEFTGPPTPFSLTNQVSRSTSPLVVVLNGAITATITK